MKKLLFPILMLLTISMQAQQAPASILNTHDNGLDVVDENQRIPTKITLGSKEKKRGPSRWYDIVDAVYKSFGGAINIYANDHYNSLWTDTTILAPYGSVSSPTYSGVWIRSVASYFDPVDPRYNDVNQYPGETAVSNNDAYTIDSLFVPFLYYRNAIKTNVIDTLIVSVVYGDGSGNNNDLDIRYYGPTTATAMNHSIDTLRVLHGFMELNPGVNQYGYLASSTTNVRTTKIPLTPATLNDTTDNGFNYVQIPINLNVPAGFKAAASIVYKSGDTWTPNVDTLYISGNRDNPNFNNFRFVAFEEVDGGYQQYTKGVWSQAALMRNDNGPVWLNRHIPCYAFNNTSYEHQWFQWKVSCAACGPTSTSDLVNTINELSIYPNPAKKSTKVSFSVDEALHDARISVMNVSGAVLSFYNIGFVENNSKVEKTISTQGIAAGMYFIQLSAAEGQRIEKLVIE